MVLHKTPWWLKAFYPSLTWEGESHQQGSPCLYLTFDDGPVPGVTPWVVETLSKYQAHATFFCVGDNIAKHPAVFSLLTQNGHKVANHTFHHVNGWHTHTPDYLKEVQSCQDALPEQESLALFRPPYGKIKPEQIKELKAKYRIVMWDVLSADYDQALSPEKCLNATIKASRPGSIVVFHDSYKAEKNLRHALPAFLEYFSSRGFQFKTL